MTYFNFIPQFNTNIWSGFSNMFSPQWSFMSMPTVFNSFGVNFSNFTMPSFNCWNNLWNNSFSNNFDWNSCWSSYPMQTNWNSSVDTFTRTTFNNNLSISTENRCPNLVSLGYNAQKGQKLAKIALNNSNYRIYRDNKNIPHIDTNRTKTQNKFTSNCAAYVKMAIRDAGLGNYEFGDAYKTTSILKNNKNFKQISPNSVNVNDLPAGCILVFNKGSQNYSSKHGHTEITTGTKKGASDGITNNLRKPDAIFIPV